MLDTVLQIGKAFRESKDAIKHHRYIKPCPLDTEKEKVLRLSIPVSDDVSFDLENITEITNQNEFDKLFYLRFKTSDADGLVKYLHGDVLYQLKNGTEGDYYRMADLSNKQKAYKVSSFHRGETDFDSLKEKYKKNNDDVAVLRLVKFRDSFRNNVTLLERLLKYQVGIADYVKRPLKEEYNNILELIKDENALIELTAKAMFSKIAGLRNSKKIFRNVLDIEKPTWDDIKESRENLESLCSYSTGSIFLHLDFGGKHWYDFESDMEVINEKLLEEFSEELREKNGYILKKYIYKTLSSAEKDLQFPQFTEKSRYKSKVFQKVTEINDLLYGINYSRSPLISVYKSKMRIIVLPKGYNLEANDYLNFNKGLVAFEDESNNEYVAINSNEIEKENDIDPLFADVVEKAIDKIIQFDVVFCKQGEKGKQDDLIELVGIEKSLINYLSQRVKGIKIDLQEKRQKQFKSTSLKPLSIYYSFLNILGDTTTEKKKYQSHLYKVLPQIYSGTYFNDPLLLPALIEKVEYKIRDGEPNFSFLKYDFVFLTKIQNTNEEGENLMKILESQSYKLGLSLGKLAIPLKSEIKSFEKNYVGNLTRRMATLNDLIKFKVDVEQKLIMHDKTYPDIKEASLTLTADVKAFSGGYDKHECAFGFFDSYFTPFQPKNDKQNGK